MVSEDVDVRNRPITPEDLHGLRGLRASARGLLLERQPQTVFEALCLRDVARSTTRELLKRGVLTDPTGVQSRSLNDEDFVRWVQTKNRGGPAPAR
jgi:hypothetical protein